MTKKRISVYQLDFDVNKYQCITFESLKRGRWVKATFDGSSLREHWKKHKLWVSSPKLLVPDFYELEGYTGAFVVRPEAYAKVAEFLEMSAEILPVEYNGNEWPLINITECPDCLDEKRSTFDEHGDRYVFNPHVVPCPPEPHIFKIPREGVTIFVSELHGDPETEFKAACEKHKIKGIDFKLVWEEGSRRS